MIKKSLILSSAGLKNIVHDTNNLENEFSFIFGNEKIRMSKINAEFISPLISRIHQTDPTIESYQYPSIQCMSEKITKEILRKFELLCQGEAIEVDSEESSQFEEISIILDNEELHRKVRELFPPNDYEFNFNKIICQFSQNEFGGYNDDCKISNRLDIISQIASNFYLLRDNEIEMLSKFPLDFLYSIVKCDELKLNDEDSLFEFIEKTFKHERKETKSEGNLFIMNFFEEIEIENLSSDKFNAIIEQIDFNSMTGGFFLKIKKLLIEQFKPKFMRQINSSRYDTIYQEFEYNGDETGAFKGIINQLTEECGGNVNDNGEVNVTSSSVINNFCLPKYVVDLENIKRHFTSGSAPNQWLKYDFINRSVRPTHYSIRSHEVGRGGYHPQNWVIEASNTDQQDDWKILDSRNNIKCLDAASQIHTFKIQEKLCHDEFYRFIRIRQTGKNTSGNDQLVLSSLEYFGTIVDYS